ncbi:hypothetical protein [Paenibacillus sp. TH7-28]
MSPHRFQTEWPHDILAVGSGSVFFSLLSALNESGFSEINLCMTSSAQGDRQRLAEWLGQTRKAAPEAKVREVALGREDADGWREVVRPYQMILYASQEGNPGELLRLGQACREENKALLPAVCLHQTGVAGPLVQPGLEGDGLDGGWESAWRRLHMAAFCQGPERQPVSSAAGALLANVLVSRLLKYAAGESEAGDGASLYLLNLETLEGSWHVFLPHPFAAGRKEIAIENLQNSGRRFEQNADCSRLDQISERRHEQMSDQRHEQFPDRRLEQTADGRLEQIADGRRVQTTNGRLEQSTDGSTPDGWFAYFSRLTSEQTGIFHTWEEGALSQLPLAQCRVQAADPLSEGPASLLPDIVCAGLTHVEARREAGLAGIEAYVSRLAEALLDETGGFIGIGAGETVEEAIHRGLQDCLSESFRRRTCGQTRVQAGERGQERKQEQELVQEQEEELVQEMVQVQAQEQAQAVEREQEQTKEQMHEQRHKQTREQAEEWTNVLKQGRTNEQGHMQLHERTNGRAHIQPLGQIPSAVCVRLGKVDDKRCRYYLQALSIMQGEPVIGLGEAVSGFPVFWVGTGEAWYGGVGLNDTFALRNALRAALVKAQNTQYPSGSGGQPANVVEIPSLQLKQDASVRLDIGRFDGTFEPEVLSEALQVVKRNGQHLTALDLAVEPFLKELAVFGVSLREGEASF